jgi:hypothetical protein
MQGKLGDAPLVVVQTFFFETSLECFLDDKSILTPGKGFRIFGSSLLFCPNETLTDHDKNGIKNTTQLQPLKGGLILLGYHG